MARTGGFAFFEQNEALYPLGARVVASSNQATANYVVGTDRAFRWKSENSAEGTTETLIITFPEDVMINRMFLLAHNFKTFTVQYNSAQDFTNVVGIDGGVSGGIAESDFARATAYYEFEPVAVTSLTITVSYTQDSTAEKTLAGVIATSEIATLQGYPKVDGLSFDRNENAQNNAAGGQRIVKKRKTAKLTIDMKHHPYQGDIDLIAGLFDREDPFLVWPNGGKPDQFRLALQGYRLQDVFLMQTTGTFKSNYYKNIYSLSGEQKIKLEEVDY